MWLKNAPIHPFSNGESPFLKGDRLSNEQTRPKKWVKRSPIRVIQESIHPSKRVNEGSQRNF